MNVKNVPVNGSAIRIKHNDSEESGICAVYSPKCNAAHLAYFVAFPLQHRGHAATGIVSRNRGKMHTSWEPGLIMQMSEENLSRLHGNMAIAQNHYQTALDIKQPVAIKGKVSLAVAHNGKVINADELRGKLKLHGLGLKTPADSELFGALINFYFNGSISEAIGLATKEIIGSNVFIVLAEDGIYGIRSSNGKRPLVLGKLNNGGYTLSSEDCSFYPVGASFIKAVVPGSIVHINESGWKEYFYGLNEENICPLEFAYLQRPDSTHAGASVNTVRKNLGRLLFTDDDWLFLRDDVLVVGIPDAGNKGAEGYAEASGFPISFPIIKCRYISHTGVQPTAAMNKDIARTVYSVIREEVKGKIIILVTDSLFRGENARQIIRMLLEAEAFEVHLRVTVPPLIERCQDGVIFPPQDHLLANIMTDEEMCHYLGIASLHFATIKDLQKAIGKPYDNLCLNCFRV